MVAHIHLCQWKLTYSAGLLTTMFTLVENDLIIVSTVWYTLAFLTENVCFSLRL